MKEDISLYFSLYAGTASVRWSVLVSSSFLDDSDLYKIINSLNLSDFDNFLRTGIKRFIGLLTESPNSDIILKVLYNFSNTTLSSELENTLLESSACVSLENIESLLLSKIFTIKERVAKAIFGDFIYLRLTA